MSCTCHRRGKTRQERYYLVALTDTDPLDAILQIAAGFVTNHSAFVDMDGLLAAMSSRDDLLLRFQEDEAREHLERQRQLELQRLQQEQELVQQQEQAQQQDTQDGKLTGDGSQ
jgi:hypothetical protein